jgi:hypothetical protein
MSERTLCDVGLTVSVSGAGRVVVIQVSDHVAVRFECRTHLLRAVLEGAPLQVSAPDGFCLLERRNAKVRMEFGLGGGGRKTCEFPAQDLADALDEIEARERPALG